jgi:hypothetical protein
MKAYSLHVGLNGVDPAAFGGWQGILAACQRDAAGLCELAVTQGSEGRGLLTGANEANFPTVQAYQKAIGDMAAKAVSGDTVFITHSGHGGSDTWGQFLVFYDGVIYEDDFRTLLSQFKAGVKVVVILDACHSGGLDRGFMQPVARVSPLGLLHPTEPPKRGSAAIVASVALFCACLPEQTASDGDEFGAWTGALVHTWNRYASLEVSWRDWFNWAAQICPNSQTPTLRLLGKGHEFLDARVFG